MGREEQLEERVVLDSIFPDEITNISETSYQVSIALDIELRSEDNGGPVQPSITLEVTYPPNYPDEPPLLKVTHPQDASKSDQLSFPNDAPHLLSSLDDIVHDSLGEAMIFTLISTLKDSAESLIATRISAIHAEADKAAAQAEEKENAKFHGEAVTKESFLTWREGFFREQREREEEEERRAEESGTRGKKVVKEERKLTGRELWEKGMVGKIDEEAEGEVEGERDALAEVEQLTIRD